MHPLTTAETHALGKAVEEASAVEYSLWVRVKQARKLIEAAPKTRAGTGR